MRILLTCIGLACAAMVLMISYAEKQQQVSLDTLSSYKLKPQPVLYDDPDLKQVTARSPTCETSDEQAGAPVPIASMPWRQGQPEQSPDHKRPTLA